LCESGVATQNEKEKKKELYSLGKSPDKNIGKRDSHGGKRFLPGRSFYNLQRVYDKNINLNKTRLELE